MAAAAAGEAPAVKVDNMLGMGRAHKAQMLFEHAKKTYRAVLEELEKQGFTSALTEKDQRSREEYARVIQHPLMQPVHTEIAAKCLELARENGGVYNKAAQFVASLQGGSGDTGIPKQYVDGLRKCTDQCPPRPFSDFHEMIEEELGKPWNELFSHVDEKPIGAASLAQVHRATTKDGRVIALKLQYPGLHVQLASDFFIFRMLGGMMKPMGLDLGTLLQDFESSVTRELDFLQEAANGEATRVALQHLRPRVFVPGTVPELTSKRTLAMEFAGGIVPLRVPRLREAGFSVHKVTQLVCDTFAEMACCHGRVHGDPHAGNVYARQVPGGAPGEAQIVLLDHGLYHELGEDVRLRFCRLLLACGSRRRREIRALGEEFAGPLGRFFPLVLSPWFIFGAPITLSDVRAAWRRQLPPGVSLREVGETLVKLYEGGGKTIGLLHSLGYTRGLLNDLGCGERRRLLSLLYHARVGLEGEELRPGALESRSSPKAGAELPPITTRRAAHPWRLRLAIAWTLLQVWVCWAMILVMWPVAAFFEPKRTQRRPTEIPEPPPAEDKKEQ
eukprot:TRINITY_DN3033_c0_g1_i1.p1 TRINITY_DN3033_c0_g1~~TRINITY_DN3033_c0_g1_i1.p1  ORF type:complete len:577 (+),score=222.60 TRINITY_DN3033_c0_g1_i1:57-1733(+)